MFDLLTYKDLYWSMENSNSGVPNDRGNRRNLNDDRKCLNITEEDENDDIIENSWTQMFLR